MDILTLINVSLQDIVGRRSKVKDNNTHIQSALEWLKYAQDINGDGGVASWYSPIFGWGPSYIETTGYIIDTFLDCYQLFHDQDLLKRAIKMADFLISMQLPSGGYRSVTPNVKKDSEPVIFDTGQVILGLTSLYQVTKKPKYLDSAIRAADFLCSVQESDGSWLKFTYGQMVHTYHTRVAWSLLKVYQLTKTKKYRQKAIKNLDWAANNQLKNGWFKLNQFPPPTPTVPFTHTIAYATEGFLWSSQILKNQRYLKVAKTAAEALLKYYQKTSFLPGTLDSHWSSNDRYSCLTGDAQIALVWLTFYQITKDHKWLTAARRLNNYLKTIQDTQTSNRNIRGAIKGSLPIYGQIMTWGGYQKMAYLNWATKFFIDALLQELIIDQP